MTEMTTGAAQDLLSTLKKTDKMPVMFVGHGSPMNAIGDNEYRRNWQAQGGFGFGALGALGLRPPSRGK